MKADVWMPFYVGDYIKDTLALSRADHGSYLLLILDYWNKRGPLPDDDEYLAGVAKCTTAEWPSVRRRLERFFQVTDFSLSSGQLQVQPEQSPASAATKPVWRHKRIDRELAKAQLNRKSASERGRLGAEARAKRKQSQSTTSASAQLEPGFNPSPSPSDIAGEREGTGVERPSLEEVLTYAQVIGLGEWKATDWFDEMQGCDWLDYQHRPIGNWRAVLRRVKTKWEADGRPEGPPSRPSAEASGSSVSETIRLQKELERIESRLKEISDRATHTAWGAQFSPEEKKERKELHLRKREILKALGFKA